jgi:predicted nucleotidyltransferase
MDQAPPIEEITNRIADAFHPRLIVLFGSRARGDARPDSDIDLMIVMDTTASPIDRAIAVRSLFGLRTWSLDVVVYTPAEVDHLRGINGTLASVIDVEGRVVYERAA